MRIQFGIVLLSGVLGVHAAEEKVTYEDHVRPMLENKCFSCHNPDKKKGDLDLTTFAGTMTGGAGGIVADSGNPDGSRIWTTTAKKEEPFMPPEGSPLSPADLEVLVKWINGGLLEGPVAMPEHVLLEPVRVTVRTTAVTAMAASPWGPLLAIAGQKQILLYDTDKQVLAGVLPYEEGYAQSLRFSRNGSLLILGGGRGGKFGHSVVWDVKSGIRVTEVGKEFDSVMSADISADQKLIVIGSPSKKVKCYDTATGEELYLISKHTEWVMSTVFSPDGVLLATADRNGNVMVWEASNGGEFFQLGQHKAACVDLAWRADSNVLASCSLDGSISIWEMTEGKQLKNWAAHGGGVLSVSFTPDGKLASSGKDGVVRLWDINGNKLGEGKSQVTKVVALHDSKGIVSGNWRGEVLGWNVPDFAAKGSYTANPPLIAQRIVEVEKAAADLVAALPATQQSVSKAAEELKAREVAAAGVKKQSVDWTTRKGQIEAELKELPGKLAAMEKSIQDVQAKRAAQAELIKKHGEAVTQLKAAEVALSEAKKVREGLNGPEQLAQAVEADKKVVEQQGRVDGLVKTVAVNPGDLGALDAEVKKAQEALVASQGLKPARDKELGDLVKALTEAPKSIEAADKVLADSKAALAASEAALKGQQERLAFYQKLPISLRAAQFNVGVLGEKEKLAKLDGEVTSYTNGLTDIEAKRVAAAKRLEESKVVLATATGAAPQLEATLQKLKAEHSAQDQAMAPSRDLVKIATEKVEAKRKEVATKEAELAALVKQKDAEVATLKKAMDDVSKSLEELKKKVAEVGGKMAAPQKASEDAKVKQVGAETALKTLQDQLKAQEGTLAAKNQAVSTDEGALRLAGDAHAAALNETTSQQKAVADLTAAKATPEVIGAAAASVKEGEGKAGAADQAKKQAEQVLVTAKQEVQAVSAEIEKAKASLAGAIKAVEEGRAIFANADKAVQPLRGQHASLSQEIEARAKALTEKQAQVPVLEQSFAAKLKPIQDAVDPLKQALVPLEAELKGAQEKLAGEQKVLDAKGLEVAAAVKAVEDTQKRRVDSERVIAVATQEIPQLEASLVEVKGELAKLSPQLAPLRQKVKQLEEQYFGMLPK
jgi:DNA repair exonuclease SbcCD ATPase subunit